MQVVDQKLDIQRSGGFVESNFKIKASAKAFAILSSGLYSNKIRAIVREIGTNAADAHIAAGTSEPFRVHLPNGLEPFFSVRDFGTGLSPQDIQHIYTTYFESTKTSSNDFTGCLGLGSKSPFSYTDSFTVVDFYQGKKYTYVAFIGETGFPTIALVSEEETSEKNGLEVSFPVKPADYINFREEAKYVYNFFKVRPEIVGQQVDFKDFGTPVFSGKNWSVYKGQGNNKVVMGNVAYPLDLNQSATSSNCFTYYSIWIDVEIGEAEMTASREALEYTERTKQAIKSRINECVTVFQANIQKEFDAQPTLWDACIYFKENNTFIKTPAKWNGLTIGHYISLKEGIFGHKFDARFSRVRFKKNRTLNSVEPDVSNVFIEDDLKRGAIDRTKNYLQNHGKHKNAFLIRYCNDKAKGKFFESVGKLPDGVYLLASQLAKVVRPKSIKTGPSPQGFVFKENFEKVVQSWEEEDIDLTKGGIYIELEAWSINDPVNINLPTLNHSIRLLKDIGKTVKVVGLRKKLVNKIKDDPKWVKFTDWAKEQVEQEKDNFEYAVSCSKYLEYRNMLNLHNSVTALDFGDLVNRISYVRTNERRLVSIKQLMDRYGFKCEQRNIEKEVKVLEDKYPLVFYIMKNCSNLYTLPKKDISEYVLLKDSAKSV